MILKYLIPFDRLTITCRLTTTEVVERLRAVTVKRHWLRLWSAVPGTFEGKVSADRFRLLTSAEGFELFGWARTRNGGRPVCTGRLAPAPGGCRIDLNLRPQAALLLVMAYILAFMPLVLWLYIFGTWKSVDGDESLARVGLMLFPCAFLLNYIIWTRMFWIMRNRALAAFRRVLDV